MKWTWMIVLMLACPVMGQATQPATTQVMGEAQYPAMARKLRELMAEVKSLRTENDALRAELAVLRTTTTRPAGENKQVSKGMTLAQVTKMWGDPARQTRADDELMYVWYEYQMVAPESDPGDYRGVQLPSKWIATQSEERKEKRIVRTLTCWFTDGRVTHFLDENENTKKNAR